MSRKRLTSVIVLCNSEDSSGVVVPKMSLPSQYMEVDPDIELRFDYDKIVPGHSQVLSLSSNVLKEAIKAGSGGASDTKQCLLSIPMQGTCSTEWLRVVPFFYPGEQPEVTWDNVEVLLVLGNKYDMPDLESRAAKFLDAHHQELNSIEQDSKYIWKWILLLDNAAAGKESLYENCIQRLTVYFRNTCTRENMKGLSKEAVEMLASALAGTMTFKNPIDLRGVCPCCTALGCRGGRGGRGGGAGGAVLGLRGGGGGGAVVRALLVTASHIQLV